MALLGCGPAVGQCSACRTVFRSTRRCAHALIGDRDGSQPHADILIDGTEIEARPQRSPTCISQIPGKTRAYVVETSGIGRRHPVRYICSYVENPNPSGKGTPEPEVAVLTMRDTRTTAAPLN